MATKIIGKNISVTNNEVIATFQIQLSGNYGGGATHGDTLDLTKFVYQGLGLQTSQLPTEYNIVEMPAAGTAPTGNIYGFAKGTKLSNGVFTAFTASATEYTQGTAYSAPLLAAVIVARFIFPAS